MRVPQPFENMDAGIAAARKAGKTIRGSVFGVWFRFYADGSCWPITRKPAPLTASTPPDPAATERAMTELRRFFGG